mgnify:CR=1 FL=1
MKTLILSIDYEVFLGERTGDVEEVLINPTYRLMDILNKNGSKMTVFWDVLHYYQLCKNRDLSPKLFREKTLVENQIRELVRQGHDVQMHIHPHWLDAKYEDGHWIFDYSRFSIHKLSSVHDKDDINTVIGCLTLAKSIMEEVIRPIKPDYKVKAYRAGGYLIEPFETLREVFLELGIEVDSSTCPGSKNDCIPYPFDFRGYPTQTPYRYSQSPCCIDKNGVFIEYPIKIFKLSPWFRLKREINNRRRKFNKVTLGGTGVRFPHKVLSRWEKLLRYFSSTTVQLTTDGGDESLYKYTLNHAPENSVMILHPKMQTTKTFNYLEQLLSVNYVNFSTIQYS